MLVNAPAGPNLAAPTESVVRCRPLRNSSFWRQSLTRSHNRVAVGDWNGMDLSSLASARIRCGVKAWEVDRLYLKDLEQALELLEQIVVAAGTRGAEKVFLRVPADSVIVDVARRAGFFPYYEEIHLTGQEWNGGPGKPNELQPETPDGYVAELPTGPDIHGLFQLYCAATPQQVREGIGMTFDQWSDSQEVPSLGRKEAVLKHDGKIVGWQARDSFGNTTIGQVLAHPNFPDLMARLIGMSCDTQSWLLPSYQEHAAGLLAQQGLNETGRYNMLIKNVTVPVISRERSYVEA
jgi:hypothetical protein